MIQIKSSDEIALMRQAGVVVGTTLETLRDSVKPGMTTADLDDIARDCLAKAGATSNFLGYHGFPATVCTSVNDQIVHGIPSKRAVLRDGDIVSIDFGAIIEGYHGDAAITVPVGEVTAAELELLRVTEESLWHGMAAGLLSARLIDVSRAIEDYIRSQPHPTGGSWGIVEEYVGHGIGTEMHQDPQVHNYVGPRMGKGPELVEGLALAVEPMVNLGGRHTKVLDDNWTVVTADGSRSAHFEHSFTMTEEGPWVLTAIDGGRERIAAISVAAAPA
ncbi:MAG TPA: type I methionyl aminopeptidase [Mycobacteriales bacterium]|jgi:methionyl aminopeptidase|nr:type I methionyl aminopeptidase [Mycobacteriales bacterium]